LFYLGEPLLCPELPEMIEYARAHRMRVAVSTNMNRLDVAMADRLIDSGVDDLIVSLDGATPEVYEHYRIGGNLSQVLANVTVLLDRKRERDAENPNVRLQCVVFRHNEHELPAVKALGEQLGVEVFVRQGILGGCGHSPPVKKDMALAQEWLTRNPEYHDEYDYFSDAPTLKQGACPYLWKVVTINYDGSVLPCCWAYDNRHRFGNLLEQDFAEIWNNEYFRSARRLFGRGRIGQAMPRTICAQCIMYPHLTEDDR
jgi:radical SAM protein with 4Fe4S-binding SPASM domain